MATNKKGQKSLNLAVQTEDYNFFAKLCIDTGITKTEGLTRYIRYLQRLPSKQRWLLDETSPKSFTMDAAIPE